MRKCHKSTVNGISIHAPHEGERRKQGRTAAHDIYFNPRSPRGGATSAESTLKRVCVISIHAPHEGERLMAINTLITVTAFQSTLPTRGSDARMRFNVFASGVISIHAPHEGERHDFVEIGDEKYNFNPRSPRGGATIMYQELCKLQSIFQSTLPTRGSDYRNNA